MYHRRTNFKLYSQRKHATNGCPFCDPAEIDYRLLTQTDLTYIVPNKTPYEVWEQYKVIEHLLLIPKRHVNTLNDFTDDELLDVAQQTAAYEAAGYSVYARADINPNRSVGHQHTHLIKVGPKPPRLHFYLKKPYVLINL